MFVRRCRERKCAENYNKCADTIGTVPVPCASHFECQNINIFFQIKYTEAILSNCTRKLLWFEISKMLIGVLRNKFICVIYYNFPHTFVPYID